MPKYKHSTSWHSSLLVFQISMFSCIALVERAPYSAAEPPPLADGPLICDGDSGTPAGGAARGGVKTPQARETWWLQRFNSLAANPFLADDRQRLAADRERRSGGSEPELWEATRRRPLAEPREADSAGGLNRYGLLRAFPAVDSDQGRRDPLPSQPLSPAARQPFENLRKFGLPHTRPTSKPGNPFAKAATFGTGPARYGRQAKKSSAPRCRAPRSNTYLLRISR